MPDDQLVNAILKGDTDLFADVVERHLPAVRGVCHSYERDPASRDDLVQETFIDAYKNLHKLRNPAKLGAWIVKIARRRGLT